MAVEKKIWPLPRHFEQARNQHLRDSWPPNRNEDTRHKLDKTHAATQALTTHLGEDRGTEA